MEPKVFATQGGGLVRWSGGCYRFIEAPDCPGLSVGDIMPDEWSIIPVDKEWGEEFEELEIP